jgi:ribonuclease R
MKKKSSSRKSARGKSASKKSRSKKSPGRKSQQRGKSARAPAKPGRPDARAVLAALEAAQRPLRLDALARALGVARSKASQRRLDEVLRELTRSGRVLANRRGAFLLIDRTSLRSGTVQGHPDGFGFVVLDEGGDDVYLSPKEMRRVFHTDRVAVRVRDRGARGRPEGEIAEVLERGVRELVGRFHLDTGVSSVVPSDPKQARNVMVPPEGRRGARDGQIVVLEITRQPAFEAEALGRVKEILGEATDPEMEIEIAVRTFGIPHQWPDEVRSAAAAFGSKLRPRDKHQREDLRKLPLVTIDGADARDFDDAVYAERTRKGWRLVVAIADVSHYVKPGSPLDEEARRRGTSVYFPRRVVPMLPEALSNGLCSLNPKVDRLALACDVRLDDRGKVIRSTFFKAIMRSHARLTYETVQGILDGDAKQRSEHAALVQPLESLRALYRKLASGRRRRGALDLDQPEPRFVFGEDESVTAVLPYKRLESHRIIEECMITANVEAARQLERRQIPALYRVHEGPDPDKVRELRRTTALLGHPLGGGEKPGPRHFAKLLRDVRGTPEAPVVTVLTLRSLARAVYRADCAGHFGLALDAYAHFTSPIRRYPDLLVHRALSHVLAGGKRGNYVHDALAMKSMGQLCSLYERRADEASWDVQAWLKCRYMEGRVGETMGGRITGLADFGLFIQIDDALVEGMIHISELGADYYEFHADTHSLVGRSSGRRFQLGDRVRVRCAGVRTDERKIDLVLEEHTSRRR